MATLHLELEIDSDVHPELYVRLASIERSAARQEKLRQLAATGLIWEIARLHGPAFGALEAVDAAPPPPHPVALGAPAPPVDAGSVIDHAPVVPEDVPVLVDVVDEAEIGGAGAGDPPPGAVVAPARGGIEACAPAPFAPPPSSPVELPHARTRSARIRRMKESGLFQSG